MKVTYTYTDTLQVITKLCSEIILKRKETSSLAVVSKPGQESVGRKTQAAMSEYTPAVDFKVFSRIVGYILRVNSIWMTWPFCCKIPEAAITQNKILLAFSGVVPWAGTACWAWGL